MSHDVFKALADPTRRHLLDRLRERGGRSLTELLDGLEMTRQAVSQHLDVLEAVDLVVTRRQGREKLHYLNAVPIQEVYARWTRKYEQDRLDALDNLKVRLETDARPKTNGASMDTETFVYVTYIDTTAEQLWEALTSPDFTEQYWGGRRIQSDWEVGSEVRHIREDGDTDWYGRVLRVDPHRSLSYTFVVADENPSSPDAEEEVTFQLEPYGSVMRLTVTHEGLEPGSRGFENVANGWRAILSSLKSLLERGEALTYPWKG